MPQHSAERLCLSGEVLYFFFLRLSLKKNREGEAERKAIGIPHCAAASRRR
jgi:hypothetical protein